MKQLVQSPKSGKIEIVELPYPSVGQKHVLARILSHLLAQELNQNNQVWKIIFN